MTSEYDGISERWLLVFTIGVLLGAVISWAIVLFVG